MEFDPFGDVQACCANALYPLGNVSQSSLTDIWEGPRAESLRSALRNHDLSLGCSVCRFRLQHAHGDVALEYYNSFPMPEKEPYWPFSLQFSLHNTCNLACAMCGADRSSKIRSQRSGLEPLAHAYDDSFFEQILPFIHNAGAVDFSGGEPFLIAEHGRLWEMLIDMDDRPLCSLTTNGTVWNARTERVLSELDSHISVSIDGMTRETFEAVRVGADFEVAMTNLDRFHEYTKDRGTRLTLSWSLVRDNWFELGSALRFAEERQIPVKVLTVIEPDFGAQRLPTEELEWVVRSMEAESTGLLDDLDLNREVWVREVERLSEELSRRTRTALQPLCMEPASPRNVDHVVDMMLDSSTRQTNEAEFGDAVDRSVADLQRWCGVSQPARVELNRQGALTGPIEFRLPGSGLPPISLAEGTTLSELLRSIEAVLNGFVWIGDEWPESDRLVQTVWIGRSVRDKVGLVIKLVTIVGPSGVTLLIAADSILLPPSEGDVPVKLSTPRRTGVVS